MSNGLKDVSIGGLGRAGSQIEGEVDTVSWRSRIGAAEVDGAKDGDWDADTGSGSCLSDRSSSAFGEGRSKPKSSAGE
jgi:hypothetical protein